MFSVVFVKQIFDAEEPLSDIRFAVLQRKETLAFAPCPGHEFFWATERPQKLVSVTWNFSESNFSCKVEDAFLDSVNIDGLDFDELVEDAQSCGWTLVEEFAAQ